MDTLVVILIAVLVVVIVWWAIERHRLSDHLHKLYRAELATQAMLTSRQSRTKFSRTSRADPGVDAKARTTRRDSHDLEVRGGTQQPIKFRTVGGPDGTV